MEKSYTSDYILWMCKDIMHFTQEEANAYNVLCHELIRYEFDWHYHKMDENRANDGLQIRKEYELDKKADLSYFGNCTVLEMMVALADRIERQVMSSTIFGDRTKKWFFVMLENLGLLDLTNENWKYEDGEKVKNIVDNFVKRHYLKNGKGGLFPIKGTKVDQRNIQIWGQAVTFLNQNYTENDKFLIPNFEMYEDSRPKKVNL